MSDLEDRYYAYTEGFTFNTSQDRDSFLEKLLARSTSLLKGAIAVPNRYRDIEGLSKQFYQIPASLNSQAANALKQLQAGAEEVIYMQAPGYYAMTIFQGRTEKGRLYISIHVFATPWSNLRGLLDGEKEVHYRNFSSESGHEHIRILEKELVGTTWPPASLPQPKVASDEEIAQGLTTLFG